eukprot:365981-Chlamydomonas_euryale.AAC.2
MGDALLAGGNREWPTASFNQSSHQSWHGGFDARQTGGVHGWVSRISRVTQLHSVLKTHVLQPHGTGQGGCGPQIRDLAGWGWTADLLLGRPST